MCLVRIVINNDIQILNNASVADFDKRNCGFVGNGNTAVLTDDNSLESIGAAIITKAVK